MYAEDLLAFLSSRGMRVPEELSESRGGGAGLEPHPDRRRRPEHQHAPEAIPDAPDARITPSYRRSTASRRASSSPRCSPGVILLDISLPGIDGHKLCRRIKEDPALGAPIIIAITGLAEEDVEATIIAEGADAFFRKPLDFEKLREKIEELATARGRGKRRGAMNDKPRDPRRRG